MGLAARLDKLMPDISAAALRFPVPAAVSLALCLYWNVVGVGAGGDDPGYVMAGCAAAFIGSGAAHLYAEGARLSRAGGIVLALAAGAAAALLGYFTTVFETSLLFLFLGLIPVLMVAAYLRAGVHQGAIWLFNLRFGLAALLAAIVAIVFAAGLSAVVEALNFLFEAGISYHLHERIWGTAASLVGPIYGLSLMPRDLDEELDLAGQKDTMIARGVSVLVNYVLVPIIVVYAAILHAYAVKIVLDGALPKGQIATMVSIFAVGGTGAWLVAWPWRDTGSRLLRLFMKGWFFLTVVPAVLLSIAIWRRVSDYGVTPDRYGILLIALWLAFITVYLALRRNRADMRAILGGIAVLLLVGSVGPLGANGLTIASQFARLTALLESHGFLSEGKIASQPVSLDSDSAGQAASMLSALREAGGLDRLRPWFIGDKDDPFLKGGTDWALEGDISMRLGLSNPVVQVNYVSFSAAAAIVHKVEPGARLIGPYRATGAYNPSDQLPDLSARFNATTLAVRSGTSTWTIPVRDFLEKLKAGAGDPAKPQPPIVLVLAPGVTLLVDSAYGSLAEPASLGSASFWLVDTRP